MKVNGKVTPVYQERTWDEDEESMAGLMYSIEGSHFCVLTEKPIAHEQSEYTKKSGPG